VRDVPYVCGVASDLGVRRPAAMQQAVAEHAATAPRPRGQPRKPRPARRHDAQAITAAHPEDTWQIVDWRAGSRGPLRKPFVALRLHAGTGCARHRARHRAPHGRSWTGPEGGLLGERPLPGAEGEPKWFFSSLPADTSLARLVALSHSRWPSEQFYEDAKGESGLEHFQGRRWDGLQRHLALVMLASTFLLLQSLARDRSAVSTAPALGAACPPGAADQSARLPTPGAGAALPGSGLRAH
jgi:hypothetical protein